MKKLYYKFAFLLIKPFWNWTISIIIIILIRICLFQIVYAEDIFQIEGRMSKSEQVFLPAKVYQDYNKDPLIKISEDKYVTDNGDIIVIHKNGVIIVNPFEDLRGNELTEVRPQHSLDLVLMENMSYTDIIKKMREISIKIENREELLDSCMCFMETVMNQIYEKARNECKNPADEVNNFITEFFDSMPNYARKSEFLAVQLFNASCNTYLTLLVNKDNYEYSQVYELFFKELYNNLGDKIYNEDIPRT